MTFGTFWVSCIVLAGGLAAWKRRSIVFWTLAGVITGPLAAVLVLCLRRRNAPQPYVPPSMDTSGINLRPGDVVEGLRAQIELREEGITIRRDTEGRNLILHGLKGEKRIPYRSITAVQLRVPGELTSGYIQLSILGGTESARGIFDATTDENSVLFLPEQTPRMVALRDFIEQRISGASAGPAVSSTADELTKLADLRDRGAIDAQEFEAAKAALLKR
ncbi:MAG: SHOCT domain-containing protein [Pseudomonadota bacterium]|nr:SHOCT domain-containing protein [Pseudomonadota bacterium]